MTEVGPRTESQEEHDLRDYVCQKRISQNTVQEAEKESLLLVKVMLPELSLQSGLRLLSRIGI